MKKNILILLIILFNLLSCSEQNRNVKTIEYYNNGKIKTQMVFNKTKPDSMLIYYDNGSIYKVIEMTDTIEEGYTYIYDSSGNLLSAYDMHNNQKSGMSYDFYLNRKVKSESDFFNNRKVNDYIEYDSAGRILKYDFYDIYSNLRFYRKYVYPYAVVKEAGHLLCNYSISPEKQRYNLGDTIKITIISGRPPFTKRQILVRTFCNNSEISETRFSNNLTFNTAELIATKTGDYNFVAIGEFSDSISSRTWIDTLNSEPFEVGGAIPGLLRSH